MIATENLYLTADESKVVGIDSPDQAFLLAAIDSEVPQWAIDKFNLGKKAADPKANKAANPSENKKA